MAKPIVCVLGAGTAGLEGLLAARAELGPQTELTLVAPEDAFRYRPMTRESLFRPARERELAIAELAAETGTKWIQDRAEAVHEDDRVVLTRNGDTVGFDYLLLAIGAATHAPLRQGNVWERGRDPGVLDRIIREIVMDEIRTVAINIPRGARWPLPGYELALVLGWRALGSSRARVTLLTAEERPLGALGSAATDAVSAELAAAGVEVIAGVDAYDEESPDDDEDDAQPSAPIALTLRTNTSTTVAFDRLISLPTVIAPFLAGVPTDAAGFVEVDDTLKVCGSDRVWAAGSCIAAELEHSALAAQQADAAIRAIAAEHRGMPPPTVGVPELTGMILTSPRARWLAENPPGIAQPSTRCLWWPPGRAVGRMLAQRIEAWDPAVHQQLPSVGDGVAVRAPIALGCTGGSAVRSTAEISSDVRAARLRDVENRQLMAVRRREREAEAELRAMRAGLEEMASRQEQVIRELRRQGYLHSRP